MTKLVAESMASVGLPVSFFVRAFSAFWYSLPEAARTNGSSSMEMAKSRSCFIAFLVCVFLIKALFLQR